MVPGSEGVKVLNLIKLKLKYSLILQISCCGRPGKEKLITELLE